MKTRFPSLLPRRRSGMALVIVLAILVLVFALAIGFLTRVTTERTSADRYASAVSTRLLAESSLQMVQAQINAATGQGTGVAWSSQPGLLRTFSTTGEPAKSYKLYSSAQMQVGGALNPATEAAALSGWNSAPAHYTDLNQPVDTDFDTVPDAWPILDPSAIGAVEGFAVSGAPTGADQGITNTAPMPVSWLYMLKDGQVLAPTGSGGSAKIDAATSANPIVGRIAFWADDETAKINLNTASDSAYWDMPRADTAQERNLGKFQPARNEFQTYPGHPASTSLKPVFPELSRTQIFDLAPRLRDEGSRGLTIEVNQVKPFALDQDRLYATTGDVVFAQDRTKAGGLTQALLERGKFFLTTTSRAPETNLFNLPKITAWPIHSTDSTTYRTANDRLIAFCGTVNGLPFYFQRQNAASATDDYEKIGRNRTLYTYLRDLTDRAAPGFGGKLSDKYGADHPQILTEILDYIRATNLYDGNLAKANRYTFGTKVNNGDTEWGYGQVMPLQIGTTRGFGRFLTFTEFGLWFIATGDSEVAASNDPGVNLTLYPGDASGKLVSTATTRQVRVDTAFLLEPFCAMQGFVGIRPDVEVTVSGLDAFTLKGDADASATPINLPPLDAQTEAQAGVYRFTKNPASTNSVRPWAGHIGMWPTLSDRGVRARNQGRLPRDAAFTTGDPVKTQQFPFVGEPQTVTVSKAAPRLVFTGGPVEVLVKNRATGDILQRMQMTFPDGTFPVPGLTNNTTWTAFSNGKRLATMGGNTNFFPFQNYTAAGGIADVVRTMVPSYQKAGAAQSGDLRLVAARATDAEWAKHPAWDDATVRLANSLMEQSLGWYPHIGRRGADYTKAITNWGGKLANMTQNYTSENHPDTPYPALDAQATGDWDNGMVNDMDGPFINKPDEGVTYTQSGVRIPYFESYAKEDFNADSFFSPNRVIPSPGMFGSLSTGVQRGRHWETLLFRRQPRHPGYNTANGAFATDPDYLWLDLFWMPVVEPYAISEPLSTAGKINLNTQVIPFTWLKRETGLRAVLRNEKVMSIPNTDATVYKDGAASEYRREIKVEETLAQLKFRFENTDGTGLYAFRSPAEICDFHIIPSDASPSTSNKAAMDQDMATYWSTHALTGDNSRERIYTTLYPRLTTKSNTYTVHYRVQALKKRRNSDPTLWEDGKDLVAGDYRGSTVMERFIDPNQAGLPDYAANPDAAPAIDTFYRWRIRGHQQFAP
jgi:uncharacterized protein (TIGR02600 family)